MADNSFKKALQTAENILVITHVGPDGDAIGSLTAVGQGLVQLGKQVDLVCDDGAPDRFGFMSLTDTVKSKPSLTEPYDLLIAVDCGDELRMGNAFAKLPEPKPFVINIDHHITNTQFGQVNIVNPTATSTTEMLFDLLQEIDVTLDPDIALSLLTGLVTDTLGFRTVGVTARTLNIASNLIEAGADLAFVTTNALNVKPLSTIELWRVGLNNMKMEEGFVWTVVRNEERQRIGFAGASTNGLVNILADIKEAAMGAALLEMSDGTVRVGFRCRPPHDVAVLAADLGGGGHPLASGCTLQGPIEKAEALVLERGLEHLFQQRQAELTAVSS